jgi:hypothetical protein
VAKDVATWKKLLEQNADVKAVADSLVTKAMDVLGENCKYLEGKQATAVTMRTQRNLLTKLFPSRWVSHSRLCTSGMLAAAAAANPMA